MIFSPVDFLFWSLLIFHINELISRPGVEERPFDPTLWRNMNKVKKKITYVISDITPDMC
jgi:hypothetical protein